MNSALTFSRQRGSALLSAIIFMIVLSSVCGSYLLLTTGELKRAHETALRNSLMSVAEAGAEEAVRAINNDKWTDWALDSSGAYTRTIKEIKVGEKPTIVRLRVENWSSLKPILYTDATAETLNGKTLRRQLRIDLQRRTPFDNGLVARKTIVLNGNNFTVDAFDSRLSPDGKWYDWLSQALGSVGSISVELDAVDIGNANIFGFIATGGEMPDFGPNGRLWGEDTPSNVKIDESRIALDFRADFPMPEVPGMAGALTFYLANTMGTLGTEAFPTKYVLNSLSVGSNNTLNIVGPTIIHVKGDVDIKGGITIGENASLIMYVDGNFAVGGNSDGVVNKSGYAKNVRIYGTNKTEGDQTFTLRGNGGITGVIYAPNANLTLNGGGNAGYFTGAAVAYTIKINGGSTAYMYHYDLALKEQITDKRVRMTMWKEITTEAERNYNFPALDSVTSVASSSY